MKSLLGIVGSIANFININKKNYFRRSFKNSIGLSPENFTKAVMVINIAATDGCIDESEKQKISSLFSSYFILSENKSLVLVEDAIRAAVKAGNSNFYEKYIAQKFSEKEKDELLELMWTTAIADNKIHLFEQYAMNQLCNFASIPLAKSDKIRQEVTRKIGAKKVKPDNEQNA